MSILRIMELVRTTLRLKKNLKLAAQRIAFEERTTLQAVLNAALLEYIAGRKLKSQKKIKIKSFNLGASLDNLTRDDYYDDPDFS